MKSSPRVNNIWKRLKTLALQAFITLVLLEIVLRIYNPVAGSIKGEKIILYPNYKVRMTNKYFPNIPSEWEVSTNSIGFRGPEPLSTENGTFKIIAVGGSTTFCINSRDQLTWPAQLQDKLLNDGQKVWVNNAGLQGHSTYGHTVLLRDHVLKRQPDAVLFLVGVNDMQINLPEFGFNSFSKDVKFILYKSEIVRVLLNLQRLYKSRKVKLLEKKGATFDIRESDSLHLTLDEKIALRKEYTPDLDGYDERLSNLIRMCQASNIKPIVITQPLLFGDVVDPTTGIDLSNLKLQYSYMNSGLFVEMLELVNTRTREVSSRMHIDMIDLAKELPKDSKYYIDGMHFTPDGNELIADILAKNLKTMLDPIQEEKRK